MDSSEQEFFNYVKRSLEKSPSVKILKTKDNNSDEIGVQAIIFGTRYYVQKPQERWNDKRNTIISIQIFKIFDR